MVETSSDGEKEAFVYRSNFARRNLSPEQRAELLLKMKATAAKLRQQDAKKWTQKRVAETLGVDRTTVAKWFISNVNNHKANKPDARLSLSKDAKAELVSRVESGENQQSVADDLKISQGRVSQIDPPWPPEILHRCIADTWQQSIGPK